MVFRLEGYPVYLATLSGSLPCPQSDPLLEDGCTPILFWATLRQPGVKGCLEHYITQCNDIRPDYTVTPLIQGFLVTPYSADG